MVVSMGTMVVVMMVVRMFMDEKMGTRNTTTFGFDGLQFKLAGQAELGQFAFQGVEGEAQVEAGAEEHVTADAGKTIEV